MSARILGLPYWLQGSDNIVENLIGSTLLPFNSALDVTFDLDNQSVMSFLTAFILSSQSAVHQLSTHSPTHNQIMLVSVLLQVPSNELHFLPTSVQVYPPSASSYINGNLQIQSMFHSLRDNSLF